MSTLTRLDNIDWDFPRAGNVPGSIHTVHWFPGNFIPQIPAAIIQLLSQPGDLVFDPFAGSGTTAVEAMRLGRRAIVSDLISASTLICDAKIAMQSGGFDGRVRSELLSRLTFEHECRSDYVGKKGEGSDAKLSQWYAPNTLSQLRFLWSIIEAYEEPTRKILSAIFSGLLFDCASTSGSLTRTGKRRRHHWGWIADNVLPTSFVEHNAIAMFSDRLAALESGAPSQSGGGLVVRQDARAVSLPSASVDLVVTSPPYIGVIDYTLAHRMLYLWMGWSMERERYEEIGARFRRTRRKAVEEYLLEMNTVRDEIFRALRPGGYCALVLGESRRFPGTAKTLFANFSERMPIAWGPLARYPTRRRISDRAASDPVEFITIFGKP